MAYFCVPYVKTCATQGRVDTRCPILISTYSFMVGSGRVADFRVRSRTGVSPGFTLRYRGGVIISAGSLRDALAIAAWMSCAAASMFRLRLNCTVMRPTPSPLTDVIESTPAMAANSFSSGVAIDAAMVEGLAPGMLVETEIVGKSTLGSAATGRNGYPASPTRTIASVSAVVITGRWMQSVGSDMSTLRDRSGLRLRLSALRPRNGHARSIVEPQLSVDHDAFAGTKPAGDDGPVAHSPIDAHQPQLDGRVVLDDEHIGAVLADLDGWARDHDRMGLHPEREIDVDELAGPQPDIVVRKRSLQRNRAGCRVDLVVDKGERAGDRFVRRIGHGDDHGKAFGVGSPDVRQVPLGNGEAHVDRSQLRDRDQRHRVGGGVVRFDHVAALEVDRAGSPGDRRAYGRVAQIDASILNGSLIGTDGGLQHLLGHLRIFELLRRRDAAAGQLGLPLELKL